MPTSRQITTTTQTGIMHILVDNEPRGNQLARGRILVAFKSLQGSALWGVNNYGSVAVYCPLRGSPEYRDLIDTAENFQLLIGPAEFGDLDRRRIASIIQNLVDL